MSMNRIRAAAALPLLVCASISFAAETPARPSCEAAATEAERTVCSDPRLARLDDRLARAWDSYLAAFDDEPMRAVIEKDRTAWLEERNACKSDAACLGKAYAVRADLLHGKSPRRRLAGIYGSSSGEMAVYPASGAYLVSIRTSDQSQGAWSCEVYGTGVSLGKSLTIAVGDSNIAAHLGDDGAMRIGSPESTAAVEQRYCGLNGSISFTYKKR